MATSQDSITCGCLPFYVPVTAYLHPNILTQRGNSRSSIPSRMQGVAGRPIGRQYVIFLTHISFPHSCIMKDLSDFSHVHVLVNTPMLQTVSAISKCPVCEIST